MDAIPDEYKCPIGMDIFSDPVIASDGHTYERENIMKWLDMNTHSPMTRQPMTLSYLVTNYALRDAIDRWKLQNSAIGPTQVPNHPPKGFTLTAKAPSADSAHILLDIQTSHAEPMETVLIAVLDTSGSMGGTARKASGNAEGPEFSRMDLIKHSMNTVAALMNSQYTITKSSLGIVQFASSASVVMPIKKMDAVGLGAAKLAVETLRPDGATNIWDGLRHALDLAETIQTPSNIQILLLTDGEPTDSMLPPMGLVPTLSRKLKAMKSKPTISTFGFGYALQSELMRTICVAGAGTYGFIPDCSMVGTVFINWCAKALLTLAHHVEIKTDKGLYQVGELIKGVKRSILIPKQTLDNAVVLYDTGCVSVVQPVFQTAEIQEAEILERLRGAVHSPTEAGFQSLRSEITDLGIQSDLITDILTDIYSDDPNEGQLTKAVSRSDWFDTWGKNHCIAYVRALELQQCINFKDKVLQHFTSDEFKELQEKGIDIFSSIPAPQVRQYSSYYGGTTPTASMINSVDMSQYVMAAGPCFTGDCLVLMDELRTKRVRDLKKGDIVWGGHKVLALTYTPVMTEVDMIVFMMGLKITPWHPIKFNSQSNWTFPAETASGKQRRMYVDAYYNLVLESGHTVEMNGITVCTLGHGFTDNSVIQHPYFGTEAVVEDLKRCDGWEQGYIVLDSKNIQRNSETGLVEKM
jgi:Mg-chelatase subunit ChlD